jgi:hypothetical protein
LPEVLRDFHSPAPNQDVRGSWQDPAAFSTIQTADLYGDGEQEIIADHDPAGTAVWRYTPPTGSKSINGGTWSHVSTTPNLLPSSPAPSQYLSFHAVRANGGSTVLTDQQQYWTWNSGNQSFHPGANSTLAPASSDPKYYLDNMSAGLMINDNQNLVPSAVYRTAAGVGVQWFNGSSWVQIGPPPGQGGSPFSDASGFGSSPAYYETLQVTHGLTGSGDAQAYGGEVLGRLADGLHVFVLLPDSNSPPYSDWNLSQQQFPYTLTALKDPAGGVAPVSEWSSIRTGDVTGDGETDVLALVNGQLQAWELNSQNAQWNQLPADQPLNLGGSLWENNASYYSTIQVGPVAGPGYPDAVIARGPFGVRTWFYCTGGGSRVPGCGDLQGKSGWTSWLPQDTSSYPQFPSTSNCPTGQVCGQAAAWAELNTQAQVVIPAGGSTLRDAWTGATAPTDDALASVKSEVLQVGGCSGQVSANPLVFSSCTVPAGSGGFTAADWTVVVNETLAEIYYATKVVDFFTQLSTLNNDTFLAEGAELPAISSSVAALGQAAGNNSFQVDPKTLWSAGLGIAAAVAGTLDPAVGAVLSIASYLAEIVPSATPDVTGPSFSTTLNELQNDFAGAVSDAIKARSAESFEVLQSYGMLRLVAQLAGPGGLWATVDAAGLSGSMQEGFALYAYKQLLPTVLERDVITNCDSNRSKDPSNGDQVKCSETDFAGAVGSPPNFTYLNSPRTVGQPITNSWPCWGFFTFVCSYTHPPTATVNGAPGSDIASKVWGALSDTCSFNGNPITEWTFDCNLGIDPMLSTDAVGGPANGWNFPTCTASPEIYDSGVENGNAGTCTSATSATARTGVNGTVKLTAVLGLPAGFHLRSAKVADSQLLYERRGRGKLLTRSSGRALGTVRLTGSSGRVGAARGAGKLAREAAGGDTVLGGPSGAPQIKLTLHPTAARRARLTLSLSRVAVKIPYGCQRLPASTSLAAQPFRLETSLKLSDGHVTRTVLLPAQWKCLRGRGGAVSGMRTVPPPALAQHPGLAVSITGPRQVIPGSVATYAVHVHNKRRGPRNRYISSLWHILIQARLIPVAGSTVTSALTNPVVRQLRELRHGKTNVLRIPVRIPSDLQRARIQRVCLATLAIADSARPASARTCSKIGRIQTGRG